MKREEAIDLPGEEWKCVVGDVYISNHGRVKQDGLLRPVTAVLEHTDRGKLVSYYCHSAVKYKRISIWLEVWKAFICTPIPRTVIYKDGNFRNCSPDNLEDKYKGTPYEGTRDNKKSLRSESTSERIIIDRDLFEKILWFNGEVLAEYNKKIKDLEDELERSKSSLRSY